MQRGDRGRFLKGQRPKKSISVKYRPMCSREKTLMRPMRALFCLRKMPGLKKYLMKLKTTLLKQYPLTAALKKSFLCFLLKNIDKLCGHPLGRILIEISRFVKGEVELGDFINGYRENLLVGTAHIDGYCDL